MATQERLYFILPGTVQRQKLDEDLDRIVQFYNDNGYLQARVESHDIQVDRVKARGDHPHRGGRGAAVPHGRDRRHRQQRAPGGGHPAADPAEDGRGVLSRRRCATACGASWTSTGASGGRPPTSTRTCPRTPPHGSSTSTFEINEGPETFVERINITGNTRSQEKILRRELPCVEGDLFTTPKLARARQRLVNLGYFEQVRATTTPGASRDKIDRQHRGHRAADRRLLPRRRLQLGRRLRGHAGPVPEQLPRAAAGS